MKTVDASYTVISERPLRSAGYMAGQALNAVEWARVNIGVRRAAPVLLGVSVLSAAAAVAMFYLQRREGGNVSGR